MKDNIHKGIHYRTNQCVAVHVSGNCIIRLEDIKPSSSCRWTIAPGLVDLQVNGYRGIDFNEKGLSEEKVHRITRHLWEVGVTSYFPTLITNSDTHILSTLRIISGACEAEVMTGCSIRGIHLEGPFLSKEDGPRGAHPKKYIKKPDWELFQKWQKTCGGKIKLITISPEWPEAFEFIEKCTASGVLVSIGHTAATPEQVQKAVLAGASMSTHLGNATHLQLPRHQNYIWEQLASDTLWPCLIADGFHLPPALLKVFLKVKPEQSILVSDATKFAGLPPGTYQSHIGGEVELNKEGRLFIRENSDFLAGSAQILTQCIDYLVREEIASQEKAIEMASVKPMKMFAKNEYGLHPGALADFIWFEKPEGRMVIRKTVKSGEVVFSADNKE